MIADSQTTGSGRLVPTQHYDDCSWEHWAPERRAEFDKLSRDFCTGEPSGHHGDDTKEKSNE
jgi:hypothetical protein